MISEGQPSLVHQHAIDLAMPMPAAAVPAAAVPAMSALSAPALALALALALYVHVPYDEACGECLSDHRHALISHIARAVAYQSAHRRPPSMMASARIGARISASVVGMRAHAKGGA